MRQELFFPANLRRIAVRYQVLPRHIRSIDLCRHPLYPWIVSTLLLSGILAYVVPEVGINLGNWASAQEFSQVLV